MGMKVSRSALEEILVIEPDVFGDSRRDSGGEFPERHRDLDEVELPFDGGRRHAGDLVNAGAFEAVGQKHLPRTIQHLIKFPPFANGHRRDSHNIP